MNLLFLDTETGGLEAGKHSLLQIGMVAYKSDYGIIGTYEANLLYDIYHVTPQSLQFNGIDLAQLASTAKRPEVVVKDIITFKKSSFEDSNPILVGHNPWLDKSMLKHLLSIHDLNIDEYFSHRLIDTMSIIWALHAKGKLPIQACSSSGAYEYFGIINNHVHDALSDAMATCKLYECLLNMI